MTTLQILQLILGIFYIAICIAAIVIVLMQRSKEDGLGGAITGQKTESFYSKNKGMSKEKFMIQLTAVLSVVVAIVSIVLSILMRVGN